MLAYFDFKPTDFEANSLLCMAGFSCDEGFEKVELYNEGKKIAPDVAANHSIYTHLLEQKKPFLQGEIFTYLSKLTSEDVLVVHNYPLLEQILQNYGITLEVGIVDIQRVAKYLLEDCTRFDLQYLRYEMQCGLSQKVGYDPQEDVKVIEALYKEFEAMESLLVLQKISFEKILLKKLPFGKYAQRYIEEIVQIDRKYLEWMLSLEDLDEDVRYSIQYYMRGEI